MRKVKSGGRAKFLENSKSNYLKNNGGKISAKVLVALVLLMVLTGVLLCACGPRGITLSLHYYEGRVNNVQYEEGSFELPTPTRTGYSFEGWFLDQEYTKPYDSVPSFTKDTTLYAKWSRNSFTVTIETNNGALAERIPVEYGQTFEPPAAPENGEQIFMGWYLDSAFTRPFNAAIEVTTSFTIYARWQNAPYTLIFDPNYTINGVAAETIKTQVVRQTLPSTCTIAREGYSLEGWYLEKSLENKYEFNYFLDSFALGGKCTLYAKWQAIKYLVSYYDGDTLLSTKTSEYLSEINAYTPTKEGYLFDGWFTDSALTQPLTDLTVKTDTTLYAKFSRGVDVKFYCDGAVVAQTLVKVGSAITPPSEEGYSYGQWYTDADLNTIYTFDALTDRDVENGVVLYGTRTAGQYQLTVVADNGGLYGSVDGGGLKTYNSTVTVKATAYQLGNDASGRDSKVLFLGWYKDGVLMDTGTSYSFLMPHENFTLEGRFGYYLYYSLSFSSYDTSMGTVTGVGSYLNGSKATLNATAAEGYKFVGWFDGTTLLSSQENYSFTMPERDIEITPKFREYKLRQLTFGNFDTAAGSVEGEGAFEQLTSVTVTAKPNLTGGYIFVGWYDGENLLSEDVQYTFSMPTNDYQITPVFALKRCTVTIKSDDGYTDDKIIECDYGQVINISDYTTSKQGYVFNGWKIGGKLVYGGNYTVYKDIELTPQWQYGSAGFTFGDVDGKRAVIAYSGTDYNVRIPKIDDQGRAVTALGSYLFDGYEFVVLSVELHEGITYIAEYAFSGRKKSFKVNGATVEQEQFGLYVDTLYIPSSVTYIGESAFAYCRNLNLLVFAGDISSFSGRVFNYLPANALDVHCPVGSRIETASRAATAIVLTVNGTLTVKSNQEKTSNPMGSTVHYTDTTLYSRTFAIDKKPTYPFVLRSTMQLMDAVRQGYKFESRNFSTSYPDVKTVWDKAKDVLSRINQDGDSDYDKIHHIYDWIAATVTYDKVAAASNSVSILCRTFYLEGVFIDNVAVCDGYAKAFELMCAIEGIEAIRVIGMAGSGNVTQYGGHAWNRVKLDGKWYFVDTTWADGSETYINHNYLLKKDPTTHLSEEDYYAVSPKAILPKATSDYVV